MKALFKRSDLRKHESFMIWRLRQGLTQRHFGKYLGMPYGRVRAIERGEDVADLKQLKIPLKGQLTPMEMCIIARRRAKVKQSDIAKELGCCRYQVVKMEAGQADCSPLYTHWLSEFASA